MKIIRRRFIKDPKFDPANVKNASVAACGMCKWVRAMEAYDRVAKVVAPKRVALAKAEQEFDLTMQGLRLKQTELAKVEAWVQSLTERFEEVSVKKANLETEVEEVALKLLRAEKLIAGLGGEQVRWSAESKQLSFAVHNLTGDVLVCAAVLAYTGPF